MEVSETALGGFKEAIASITGHEKKCALLKKVLDSFWNFVLVCACPVHPRGANREAS